MSFLFPAYLLLLLLIIPYAIWFFLVRSKEEPALKIASTNAYQFAPKTLRQKLMWVPFVLRVVCFSMIVVVLARPQSTTSWKETDVEGIDIMLAMDVSTSMLARDFTPDRIEASKGIAIEFISQRPSDRIGVVVFAGESYTQAPLTTDRATLINLIKEIGRAHV